LGFIARAVSAAGKTVHPRIKNANSYQMSRKLRLAPTILSLLFALSAYAQTDSTLQPTSVQTGSQAEAIRVAPPESLIVQDVDNDVGGHLVISWGPSASEADGLVDSYEIFRSENASGPFVMVGNVAGGNSHFDDGTAKNGIDYYYRLTAHPKGGEGVGGQSAIVGPARASAQWFHTGRIPLLLAALILGGAVLWYIAQAKSGKELYIRRIAGLDAVTEAVGRATEMGRPVYYICGIQDMDNVETIAGTTILGRVARLTAEYEADLQVPTARSLVMVTCREVVKEAYLAVGRPDSYREDNIFYLTDDQFGFVAVVGGKMVREKPAAVFLMGAFYAESLILAETGNSVGAIQIAGTAQPAQLPFFVAACDYALIGEELFAASAYLSREPRQLGSLKGQDVGKAVILFCLAVGMIWQTLFFGFGMQSLGNFTRFFVSQ
jgi:hypothetical protein